MTAPPLDSRPQEKDKTETSQAPPPQTGELGAFRLGSAERVYEKWAAGSGPEATPLPDGRQAEAETHDVPASAAVHPSRQLPDGREAEVESRQPGDLAGQLAALEGRLAEYLAEREQADEERERFFTLSLDLLCIADFGGYFRRLNPAWERTLGWSREELLARPYLDFVHPEDRAATSAEVRKLTAGRDTLAFENRYLCKDGSYRWLLWTATPFCGQELIYASARDITERKQAEQALRDAQALYHSLVESLPVSIFRKDLQGRFLFGNKLFCQSLGRTLDDIIGKTDLDFYPSELTEKYRRDDQRVVATGEVLEDVEENQTSVGQTSWVQVWKAPVYDFLGRVIGVQGVFWDITARRVAEDSVKHTLEEFRVARQIQQNLFPAAGPVLPGFDIAGASYPVGAAGGDYFDYVPLHGGGLGVVIGDVAGHGVGPALLMATTRASLHALGRSQGEVGTILTLTNRFLADIIGDRFVTLILVRLDPRTRSFVYTNAGHPVGYVLDPSGSVKGRLESLDPPLGVLPDGIFSESTALTLEPGELVCLLTDGFLEACSPDGTAFGSGRALEVVRANCGKAARDIVHSLYQAVRAFSGNRPQADDITAVVVKVAANP